MSNNDYILNLLNIKDKNIKIFSDCIEERIIKKTNYKIIRGILTYIPNHCPCYAVVNESYNDIIKWGFKKICIVKIPCISKRMDVSVSKIDRVISDISCKTVLRH